MNYFSPLADEKPLLHTWSLGVEEQFYILFPLLLWVFARRWPRLALPLLLAITVASLALNAAISSSHSAAAFYLLPTRAWELGVGASVALLPEVLTERIRVARTVTALLGMALLVFGLFAPFFSRTPLCGASCAVVGSALLICGHADHNPVSRLLGWAPLVWIGLISYSLYLWHWPLIVFTKYYLVRALTPVDILGLWALTFAAAAASWRWIERPFRRREFPARRLYLQSAAATMLLAAVALGLYGAKGLPHRFGAEAVAIDAMQEKAYQCAGAENVPVGDVPGCELNLPSHRATDARLVLFGNSHARMYAPVWRDILAERGEPGILVWMQGCLPTVSANLDAGCAHFAQQYLDAVDALPNVDTVVLGLSWWHGPREIVDAADRPLDNHFKQALDAALDDVISRERARGRHVVLISRQLAYGRAMDRPLEVSRQDFAAEFGATIDHFSGRSDVRLARPDRIQCASGPCGFFLDGRPLFADDTHLAAVEVGRFHDIFQQALQP
jgi:hypothetical protein